MSTDDTSELRDRLVLAQEEQEHVLLRRDELAEAEQLDGYVLAVGSDWLLLQSLDQSLFLDGWTALRVEDVTAGSPRRSQDFVRRALELQGQWPPRLPSTEVVLDDVASVVRSMAAVHPLLSLHIEDADDAFVIGHPHEVRAHQVALRIVSPQGLWEVAPVRWPIEQLTRVDAGMRYESVLYDVAGPPPA